MQTRFHRTHSVHWRYAAQQYHYLSLMTNYQFYQRRSWLALFHWAAHLPYGDE